MFFIIKGKKFFSFSHFDTLVVLKITLTEENA